MGEKVTLESLAKSLAEISKAVQQNAKDNHDLKQLLLDAKSERQELKRVSSVLAMQTSEDKATLRAASPRKNQDVDLTDRHIEDARELFEMYDKAAMYSKRDNLLGNRAIFEIVRYMGWFEATMPQVEQLMIQADSNGLPHLINLADFLTVYGKVLGIMGVEKQRAELYEMSLYGNMAMLRWVNLDGDEYRGDVTGDQVPAFRRYPRLVALNPRIEHLFYVGILAGALNSGLQTYDEYTGSDGILIIERITLAMFLFEVSLKLLAESPKIASFAEWVKDMWNLFDLVLLVCLLALSFMSNETHGVGGETALQALRLLRLLRALRILRAAKVMPELIVVLETLMKSAKSAAYIGIFFFLVMYIFGIVASTIFGKNDPFHFGNLGTSIVSLFRVATMEDWTDIMYFQTYGCHGWSNYEDVVDHPVNESTTIVCEHDAFGFVSPGFFMFFLMVSAFFVLNLFVGVVVNSSIEAAEEEDARQNEAREWALAKRQAPVEGFGQDPESMNAIGVSQNGQQAFGNPTFDADSVDDQSREQ